MRADVADRFVGLREVEQQTVATGGEVQLSASLLIWDRRKARMPPLSLSAFLDHLVGGHLFDLLAPAEQTAAFNVVAELMHGAVGQTFQFAPAL